MDPNIAFGNVLRFLRLQRDISQETLAHQARLHPTYVSRLERGLSSATVSTLFDVAAALDVEPARLIQLVQDEVRQPTREKRQRKSRLKTDSPSK